MVVSEVETIMKRLRIKQFVFLACLAFALVWGSLVFYLANYVNQEETKTEAIVVLGCRVHETGAPSFALGRRTRKAVDLFNQGIAPIVVFTGGQGDHGGTEASTAAKYAKSLGLPESAIVLEETSTSTEENATGVAAIRSFENITIVTDGYHAFRAKRVFLKHFSSVSVATVPTAFPVVLKSASREILAILYYRLAGRI